MKQIGIIAEYNPFHNGHQYQIDMVKNLYPERNIIVMMSGDFVQRGEPAIFNKYLRTECALQGGADIVMELPSRFAFASAEYFAEGAVSLLDQLGAVDHLCFGSEEGFTDNLDVIACILAEEPEMKKDWDEKVGDRMIKMVIIGRHLNKEEISKNLDACLD